MNNNSKIIKLDDILIPLKEFRKFKEKHGIDYAKLEEEKIAEIKALGLSEEEEKRNLRNVKGLYLRAEKAVVKQLLNNFFSNELKENQIKLEFIYEWVDDNLLKIEEEFNLGIDSEDRLEIGFDVFKTLSAIFVELTTAEYNENEIELIKQRKEKAEQTLKENRAFHRGTPVADSIGE